LTYPPQKYFWIIIPTIGENKIHVPNHQPEYLEKIIEPNLGSFTQRLMGTFPELGIY